MSSPPAELEPPGVNPADVRRPAALTTAGITGVVLGLLSILWGVLLTKAGSGPTGTRDVMVIGAVSLVIAPIYLWGSVCALKGTNSQLLIIACGLSLAINLVTLLLYDYRAVYALSFLPPILIIAFCVSASSRTWIRRRGGVIF